jgi:hypothetical protein
VQALESRRHRAREQLRAPVSAAPDLRAADLAPPALTILKHELIQLTN